MNKARRLLAAGLLLALPAGAAIEPDDFASDAEARRYQELLAEIRCMVCENQSLADSGAGLAGDLRQAVRRLLAEGASDAEVRAFLQERYGDYILYTARRCGPRPSPCGWARRCCCWRPRPWSGPSCDGSAAAATMPAEALFGAAGVALAALALVLLLRDGGERRVPRAVKIAVAVFLPAFTAGMYALVGTPAALRPPPPPALDLGDGELKPLPEIYASLLRRLEEEPGDQRARELLIRSYLAGGRPSLALRESKRLQALDGRTARALVFEAQARYWLAQSEPTARVESLLAEALELEPANEEALSLAALLAAQRLDHAGAVGLLERLLELELAPQRRAGYAARLAEERARLADGE